MEKNTCGPYLPGFEDFMLNLTSKSGSDCSDSNTEEFEKEESCSLCGGANPPIICTSCRERIKKSAQF